MENKTISSFLQNWFWEFGLDYSEQDKLKLFKIFYVDSQKFDNVEIIDQWHFIVSEENIECDNREYIRSVRENNITDIKAYLKDGKVVIIDDNIK